MSKLPQRRYRAPQSTKNESRPNAATRGGLLKSKPARAIALLVLIVAACSTRGSADRRTDAEIPAECTKYAGELRQCFPKVGELQTFETRFDTAGKSAEEVEATRKGCAAQSQRLEASCLRQVVKRTEDDFQ